MTPPFGGGGMLQPGPMSGHTEIDGPDTTGNYTTLVVRQNDPGQPLIQTWLNAAGATCMSIDQSGNLVLAGAVGLAGALSLALADDNYNTWSDLLTLTHTTTGAPATGAITVVAQAVLVNNDWFTVTDDVATYAFEFKVALPFTPVAGRIAIDATGCTTVETVRDAVIAAINATAIRVTAGILAANQVFVGADHGGTAFNVAMAEHVAAAAFAVTGLASGTDVAAAGMGDGIKLRAENAGGVAVDQAALVSIWTDPTGGAEASDVLIMGRRAGLALTTLARFTSTGGLLCGDVTATTDLMADTFDASAGVTYNLILGHRPTPGAAVAGLGVGIVMRGQNAAGTLCDVATIAGVLTNVGVGTEAADIVFQGRTAGAALAEIFRISGAGVITLQGSAVSKVVTLTDAAHVAIDASLGDIFTLLCTAAVGATRVIDLPTHLVAGRSFTLLIKQSAGGANGYTWNVGWIWPNATAPTPTATANAVDRISADYTTVLRAAAISGYAS